jgi:hypothetical protein
VNHSASVGIIPAEFLKAVQEEGEAAPMVLYEAPPEEKS